MTRKPALRDHVVAGILDVSATVLAERGEAASMADIAAAAGVARATLYRYFPNRDILVKALTEAALADLAARVSDAKLDEAPVGVAIERMTRAVIATTSKYRGLTLFGKWLAEGSTTDQPVIGPLLAQFERGAREGVFRADLPPETLFKVYIGLLDGVAGLTTANSLGVEQASAAITTIFLTGALSADSRPHP